MRLRRRFANLGSGSETRLPAAAVSGIALTRISHAFPSTPGRSVPLCPDLAGRFHGTSCLPAFVATGKGPCCSGELAVSENRRGRCREGDESLRFVKWVALDQMLFVAGGVSRIG